MLESRDLAEGVSRHVFGGRTTRSENIDRDKLVRNAFFLQRQPHRPHIDAVGCTKNSRLGGGPHFKCRRLCAWPAEKFYPVGHFGGPQIAEMGTKNQGGGELSGGQSVGPDPSV